MLLRVYTIKVTVYVNVSQTIYLGFNQQVAMQTLSHESIKPVESFTYLGMQTHL